MEAEICIINGTIICTQILNNCIPGPNDVIGEEKTFEKIVIRKERPLALLKPGKKVVEIHTKRFVKNVIPHEDGNVTVETLAASYLVKSH